MAGLVLLGALAGLGLLLVKARIRRCRRAVVLRSLRSPDSPASLPDLSHFRPVEKFFTRADLAAYLDELARFQRESIYALLPEQIEHNLQRVVNLLILAGEMARREKLPEGDTILLYLAVIYSSFITPEMNPVFHTLHDADLAWAGLTQRGFTRYAALRVQRAIKEYPGDNPCWTRRLAEGVAAIARSTDSDRLRRQVVFDVLEKGEADYQNLLDAGNLPGEALWRRFGRSVLTYPPPSTPETWESEGEFMIVTAAERRVDRIRVYSVGTPGGADWDWAVINAPGVGRRHIAIGPLDLFINDTNAASAIHARKTMQRIFERRPLLYQQWAADKAEAKKMLARRVISPGQYSGFKAQWHQERGLPWAHYAHKQAAVEEMAALPESLARLARPRGGGYNQLTLLLHDCHNCVLPTPDAFLDDLTALDRAGEAIERMKTEAGRSILSERVRQARYFLQVVPRPRQASPEELRLAFADFAARQGVQL